MIRIGIIGALLAFTVACFSFSSGAPSMKQVEELSKKTAFDFSFPALTGGKQISLADYKGRCVLVVNTASQCGFTKQYEGLEKLFREYEPKGLTIIGVPSNDFGGQEPGSSEEIAHFCKLNYGVSFPMTKKQVVSGEGAHPFYIWARVVLGRWSGPKWNFHKYLLGKNGNLVESFGSMTSPSNEDFLKSVQTCLSAE